MTGLDLLFNSLPDIQRAGCDATSAHANDQLDFPKPSLTFLFLDEFIAK